MQRTDETCVQFLQFLFHTCIWRNENEAKEEKIRSKEPTVHNSNSNITHTKRDNEITACFNAHEKMHIGRETLSKTTQT